MKSPLRYQATEYDCGPTTMTNAIMFLFEREEIPPDLVRHIGQCTLDSYDEKGHAGMYGTSGAAIRYFGAWLNELRHGGLLPVQSSFLEKEDVLLEQGEKLHAALVRGCVVVLHVFLNGFGHYILLTGFENGGFLAFDPYYPASQEAAADLVKTHPFSHNRIIPAGILNSSEKSDFAMGPVSTREALLIERHDVDTVYMI